MSEQTMWAVKRPGDCDAQPYAVAGTSEIDAWELFLEPYKSRALILESLKEYWETRGYRIVRVRITEVQDA